MKIKIIKPDGSKAEVDIDGSIDFQGMGVLSPDEVTALKTRAEKSGEDKASKAWQEKLELAEKKLSDYESNLTDRQRDTASAKDRIAAMEKTVQDLRNQMERATKEAAEANMSKALADARSGLAFMDGGQTIFDMQMRSKMQPDGTYILATGERGTLEQARNEWIGSPVGKALIKAVGQRDGSGTAPSGITGVSFGDIVKDFKLKKQYIEQHGEAKYAADFLAHKESQKK